LFWVCSFCFEVKKFFGCLCSICFENIMRAFRSIHFFAQDTHALHRGRGRGRGLGRGGVTQSPS